jgi:hypothetical protein
MRRSTGSGSMGSPGMGGSFGGTGVFGGPSRPILNPLEGQLYLNKFDICIYV